MSGGSLRRINEESINRICASQVIIDLKGCIKELIENALDAKAKTVQIVLVNDGTTLIEVVDDGDGISFDEIEHICTRNSTSKIKRFDDINASLQTFGFRGEALNSLCAVGKLSITSRTIDDDVGYRIEFNSDGTKKSIQRPIPRGIGTTVTAEDLFCFFPVRQREFHRTAKAQIPLVIKLVTAYSIIKSNVKFIIRSQSTTGRAQQLRTLLSTTGIEKELRESITSLFGTAQARDLVSFSLSSEELDDTSPLDECSDSNRKLDWTLSGLLLPPSLCHRKQKQLAFMFVNGRPIENGIKKILTQLTAAYKTLTSGQSFPQYVLCLDTVSNLVDFNLTPDKLSVFIQEEEIIANALHSHVMKLFESQIFSLTLQTELPLHSKVERPISSSHISTEKEDTQASSVPWEEVSLNIQQPSDTRNPTNLVRSIPESSTAESVAISAQSVCAADTPTVTLTGSPKNCNVTTWTPESNHLEENETNDDVSTTLLEQSVSGKQSDSQYDVVENPRLDRRKRDKKREHPINISLSFESNNTESPISPSEKPKKTITVREWKSSNSQASANIRREFEIKKQSKYFGSMPNTELDSNKLRFEESEVLPTSSGEAQLLQSRPNRAIGLLHVQQHTPKKTGVKEKKNNEIDSEELEKIKHINLQRHLGCEQNSSTTHFTFPKSLFSKIRVIGQFNLGFIIGSLNMGPNRQEIFIIDQHATDEKSRFEHLYKTKQIQSQRIVVPLTLELPPAQQQVILNHLSLFRMNGFHIVLNKNTTETSRSLQLEGLPMLHRQTLSVDDLRDLIQLILENGQSTTRKKDYGSDSLQSLLRPQKIRSIMASWACRSAVMIGQSLSHQQMKSIIDRMTNLDQPWNCPHGRPTMRHLHSIAT